MNDALTPAEKNALANSLSALARLVFSSSLENEVAELVDNAIAHANAMVEANRWHPEVGQAYISSVVNASSSYYASKRLLREEQVRNVISTFLFGIAGIVNERLGIDILPTAPPQ